MRSRDLVSKTLEFENPPRVAVSFGDSDVLGCSFDAPTRATDWREVGGGCWERLDEWGNTWARLDATSKGEVAKGVLDSLDDLDRYEFPDFSKPEYYEPVRRFRAEHPDKWIKGNVPGFAFNIARKLRRIDQYFVDLMSEPDRIHELHDRIDRLIEDMIVNYAAAGVDAIMFPEDWGTQTQLFIAPSLWREEYFPRFVKLCGVAHDRGIKVFMHSCGQIEAIVPGLIEAGVDVLQFDQPELHGIDVLAAHQANNKITFWCPVDIQKTLQTRDEQRIRATAREMLDKLWRGRGGFIAGYYGDNVSIGLDPKWQEIACDEFIRCGRCDRYLTPTARTAS